MVEPERPQITTKHGAYASHVGYARLHADTYALTCTHLRAWTCTGTPLRIRTHPCVRAHTHTHTRAHTHRQISSTYCFFTATMMPHTHLNITLYTYIICLAFKFIRVSIRFSSTIFAQDVGNIFFRVAHEDDM